jgi:hypothetical protein
MSQTAELETGASSSWLKALSILNIQSISQREQIRHHDNDRFFNAVYSEIHKKPINRLYSVDKILSY